MRAAFAVVASVFVGVTAACDGTAERSAPAESSAPAETGPPRAPVSERRPGWNRLPDPPLTPRTGAAAAWTGREIVVVGGWEFLCPPWADCSTPLAPPFSDGAAFNPATGGWRAIAPAPVGFTSKEPAVVNGDVYVLAPCTRAQCGADGGLLRYRPEADVWDVLPGPPMGGGYYPPEPANNYLLEPAGDDLVAFSPTDELGERPDWRLDLSSMIWEQLPDDPLPYVFDRHLIWDGSDLMVFAKPTPGVSDGLASIIGARLDEETGAWEELPAAPTSGFQAWSVDGLVIVNPHYGTGQGGIFDPSTKEWRALPDEPADESWRGDMAGVLGREAAVFAWPAGWVLDLTSGSWIEIAPFDDRSLGLGVSSALGVTAVGRSLFVFGGERWSEGFHGELLGDAWMWEPPAATAAAE